MGVRHHSRSGLAERRDEARADVERAIGALKAEGLSMRVGPELQIEYPVAGAGTGGLLFGGYIDLVGVTGTRVDIFDFKTDTPPEGDVEREYPQYAEQVRAYGRLLDAAGVIDGRRLRCGLLFTADGRIRWVEPRPADLGESGPKVRV